MDDYWDSAKQLLNDAKFLDYLITFNKDTVPEATIHKLQPYIQSNDFRPFVVAKVTILKKFSLFSHFFLRFPKLVPRYVYG